MRTAEDSKELSESSEPCIVVASGGMCDGGRILTYLRQYIDDPRATIVLVSYQATHSLGAELLEKRPTVRFHGHVWNKWAEVVEIKGFSGHADQNDFMALLGASARTDAASALGSRRTGTGGGASEEPAGTRL